MKKKLTSPVVQRIELVRQRAIDPEAFKSFLRSNRRTFFGCREFNCPLSKWLEEEITLEDLDDFPAWANRFSTAWQERLHGTERDVGLGCDAFKVLREVLVW
jgi:hypothetical protein